MPLRPGIYDWSKHKAFAQKQWYDVQWTWPAPATNPMGTSHTFTTVVAKYSDGTPLAGYVVNYKVVSGPAATLRPGDGSVKTNAKGEATVKLTQVKPAAGTNQLAIEIIRPENKQCCTPAVHLADGTTQKDVDRSGYRDRQVGTGASRGWPAVRLRHQGVEHVVRAGQECGRDRYAAEGIAYVSSTPKAAVSGQTLTWDLGTMAPSSSKNISVQVKGNRTGKFTNCA